MTITNVGISAYQNISSGQRINSAADDAAGLSIATKMDGQTRAMEKNIENIGSMSDLTQTAEGSLGSIQDSLIRIRELTVQAGNGILSDGDRSVIQSEVSELLQNIQSTAEGTEFNTMKLLDGSFANKNTAMNPDGTGKQISIENTSLQSLGIDGFSVTDGVGAIDTALEKVTQSRSNLGSVQNAFEHATRNKENAVVNLSSAKSQIQDADIAAEISKLKKEQILQQYQIFAQKTKDEQRQNELGALPGFNAAL